MSLINQVRAAVKDTGKFRTVGKDLNLDSVLDQKLINGKASAWVVRLDRNPVSQTRDIGDPVQIEEIVFGVVIGIKTVRTETDDDLLDELCGAVRAKVFNQPIEGYDNPLLAASGLVKYVPGAMFWVERFKTKHVTSMENLL